MHTPNNAVQGLMARPTVDTTQVTFRIPTHWLTQADAVATILSRHGMEATRTDVFREAIARGMAEIVKDQGRSHYRVSAWDGRSTTCLYWFGPREEDAIAEVKRLASEARLARKAVEGGKPSPEQTALARWTIFRAYRGDEADPFYDLMPASTVGDGLKRRVEADERAEKRKAKK